MSTHSQRKTLPYEPRSRARQLRRFPTLTVLSHPIPERVGAIASWREPGRKALDLSRLDPLFLDPREGKPAGLNDIFISRDPVMIRFVDGQVCFDASDTSTRVRINGRPLQGKHLVSEACLENGICVTLADRVTLLLHYSQDTRPEAELGLVGESDAIQTLREKIQRLGPGSKPVLLQGESGTGKELVAQALHQVSGRAKDLITVNMAAFNDGTAVVALFGAEKGAYTNAEHKQIGFFTHADKGSLFLDEIGETSEAVQTMLLRALDSGEIQVLGRQKVTQVDVRVIAATDANLEAKLDDASFRNAFYNRLGSRLRVPSLRERKDDLGRLILYFTRIELAALQRESDLRNRHPEEHPWIEPHHMEMLLAYDWPGNVRELANVVGDMVRHGDREVILDHPDLTELLPAMQGSDIVVEQQGDGQGQQAMSTYRKPAQVSLRELIDALQTCGGNRSAAAEKLSIQRPSIYDLCKKFPDAEKAARIDAAALATVDRQAMAQAARQWDIGESTLRLLLEED